MIATNLTEAVGQQQEMLVQPLHTITQLTVEMMMVECKLGVHGEQDQVGMAKHTNLMVRLGQHLPIHLIQH